MIRRLRVPAVAVVAAVATLGTTTLGGCASTRYAPQVVARGELTLRYDSGFELWAGQQQVSSGLSWGGLRRFVRCVPAAEEHARKARSSGTAAVAMSTFGVIFGAGSFIAGAGINDAENRWSWIGAGVASAVLGLVFAITARALKNSANGHAVDAMNYYNDAVGSLGATCDDLTYPPSAGPLPGYAPEEPPPPPPPMPMPLPGQ